MPATSKLPRSISGSPGRWNNSIHSRSSKEQKWSRGQVVLTLIGLVICLASLPSGELKRFDICPPIFDLWLNTDTQMTLHMRRNAILGTMRVFFWDRRDFRLLFGLSVWNVMILRKWIRLCHLQPSQYESWDLEIVEYILLSRACCYAVKPVLY